MFEIISGSPAETASIGEKIGRAISRGAVICLEGDLGAGKTLFVQHLAKGLGVQGDVTSPTFNIMNVYNGRLPIYHFDLYRLEQEYELEDIGFYDYTDQPEGIVVIEWADKFADCLPEDHILLTIEKESDDVRHITFELKGNIYGDIFQEVEKLCQF
ncbi:MAG: tRNA (adenosine(37)-N6)-threonylcarbamoyltransferase complex ATPase subunit type 1 TsaE [Anaerovibrio sp.]|uniref:tRNA (adenosine(37)-N6)-threonylcarbamoyltransferase complex ATPase subunit type 1 TsaE n=1 Tax=Anaerovibrio sp. TaxID=1872532 RepID=UPI0025CC904F|nr:tRNA (adenosine(37)-N6)-threonylcarbamoyltransferase complex ATPase subunit type 1 TsaE [Anaerovibrio sp.]MCR5176690.1 tRNA (adenosine(37)-N6)-threonylcarbamoyltransferase complex ATPase subunit type 1 TsaE [Anaerovibrio sp.]